MGLRPRGGLWRCSESGGGCEPERSRCSVALLLGGLRGPVGQSRGAGWGGGVWCLGGAQVGAEELPVERVVNGEVLELTCTARARRESKDLRRRGRGPQLSSQNWYVLFPLISASPSQIRVDILCLPSWFLPALPLGCPVPPGWLPVLFPPSPVPARGLGGHDSQRERPWRAPAWHSSACKVLAAGWGEPSSRCRMVLKPSLYRRRPGPSACSSFSSAKSWEEKGRESSSLLVPSPRTSV